MKKLVAKKLGYFGLPLALASGGAYAVDYTGMVPDFTGGDAAIVAAATAVLALLAVVVVARYVKSGAR